MPCHDAHHDQLTGLPNRAAFESRLERELARREPDSVLGVLFSDLNGFKGVNDDHGHAAGDSLLRLVAQRLGRVARASDPVFRPGGDEFVILLSVGPAAVHVGVAVGTAMCPADGTTADALVGHADMAMHVHKRMTKSRGDAAADAA